MIGSIGVAEYWTTTGDFEPTREARRKRPRRLMAMRWFGLAVLCLL